MAADFTYCVLASGSGGNSLWLRAGGVELLVDAGISARRIGRALADLGTSLASVQAVLCTHGHSDHVSGTSTLARRHDVEVWCTRETRAFLAPELPRALVRELPRSGEVRFGTLTVSTAPTSHDAPGSVALAIDDGVHRLAVVTDLGVATPPVLALARSAQALLLEANHDPRMLEEGPYPWHLKRRIASDVGHLSNEQSAALLAELCHAGLTHLTLAHLSQHNNTPRLARAAIERVLERASSSAVLAVGDRSRPGRPTELPSSALSRQLGLFG